MATLPQIRKPCDKEISDLPYLISPVPCVQTCTIEKSLALPPNILLNKSRRIPHKLSLVNLNIQSLKSRNHLLQLHEFMRVKNYHIITLSETWLNRSLKNVKVEVEGYKIFRLNLHSYPVKGIHINRFVEYLYNLVSTTLATSTIQKYQIIRNLCHLQTS